MQRRRGQRAERACTAAFIAAAYALRLLNTPDDPEAVCMLRVRTRRRAMMPCHISVACAAAGCWHVVKVMRRSTISNQLVVVPGPMCKCSAVA